MKQRFTNPGVVYRNIATGVIVCTSLLTSCYAGAQQILRFEAGSIQEIATGPSITPMTSTMKVDASGAATADVRVTASFKEQLFTNVANNVTGTGLQFGATQNVSGTSTNGQPVWTPMDNVSNPAKNLFSTDAQATGLDITDSYAFSVFCATRPLAATGARTDSRQLMGQLKLSFNKGVDNPILHIVGLGGTAGNLGITTELELVSQGASLSKLSGNDNLSVSHNAILNNAINPDASSYTGAASGSVAVTGANITELVFNVFLKGDGGAADWEQLNQYNGDRWLISLSLPEAKNATSKPLPIYVTSFNVTHEQPCSATIRWKTSTELGVSEFFVEHSIDGINFDVIYSFPSGGTAEGDYYAYTYRHAINGANYFRLRTNDILNDSNYGAVVRVSVACDERPIEVFPNPAQDYVKINGTTPGQTVQLSNMFGKVQQTKKLSSADESLNLSGIQPGIYVLVVSDEGGHEVSRTRINKQ